MSEKQKKLLLALCLLFAVNMLTIVLVGRVHADLYKRGASGATVSEIQKRLKAWGYYDGSVDGVYGSRTEAAVRWFQRRNGLSVDGQVGVCRRREKRQLQRRRLSACAHHLRRSARRALRRAGRGRRGGAQPRAAPLLPGHDLRRDLSDRRFYRRLRRAVQQTHRGERLPRGAGCAQRQRPERGSALLFQPRHSHQRLDLVAAAARHDRQPPLLRVILFTNLG